MNNIFLVGNPNAGKSTIFNLLTGGNAHTGNWGGVTVEKESGILNAKGKKFYITDLPGIYNLCPVTTDEINAVRAIQENKGAVFLNVIDVNTLEKSLRLTLELRNAGLKVIVLLNLNKIAKKRGLSIDIKCLEKELSLPVIDVDLDKKTLIDKILIQIEKIKSNSLLYKKSSTSELVKEGRELAKKVILARPKTRYSYSSLDYILLHKIWGIPIFLSIMLLIFWLTFGIVGSTLSDSVGWLWQKFANMIVSILGTVNAPIWAVNFIDEAILGGVGGVLCFLPQIVLLWVCLEFLEQSGYIARLVWLVDPFCKKIGLSGRSVFSLLLGFGCTTLALPTVETIQAKKSRYKTAVMLPYLTCNAKLPVLGCVAGALFMGYSVLIIFGLYVLGVVVSLGLAFFMQKFSPTPATSEIIEFTPLRLPKWKEILRVSLATMVRFLRKIWGIILCFSILIWFLSNFTIELSLAKRTEESILASVANFLTPIFAPLGFSWGIVVALMVGIVAKEMVLSTIGVLCATDNLSLALINPSSVVHFDIFSGIAFLVFCLLYTPCISALAQLRSVLPRKIFWTTQVLQFGVAYFVSYLVMQAVRSLYIGGVANLLWVIIMAVVFVALLIVVLRKGKCSRCMGNCKFCK